MAQEKLEWRLIEGTGDFDEWTATLTAIAQAVAKGESHSTFLTWIIRGNAVIGPFFNHMKKDINYDWCKANGILMCRATTCGSTIAFKDGYIVSTSCINKNDPGIPKELNEFYPKQLSIYLRIGKEYGVGMMFRPVNNVEFKDPKDGIWKKAVMTGGGGLGDCLLVTHGMFIMPPPHDLLEKGVTLPPEKFRDKETATALERATCVEEIVGHKIDYYTDYYNKVVNYTAETFNAEMVPDELSDTEWKYKVDMLKLYRTPKFIYDRTEEMRFGEIPPDVKFTEYRTKMTDGPFVRVSLLTKGDEIYNIFFTGGIHAYPTIPVSPLDEIEKRLKGIKIDEKLIQERVEEVYNTPPYEILGTTAESWTKVIMDACRKAIS